MRDIIYFVSRWGDILAKAPYQGRYFEPKVGEVVSYRYPMVPTSLPSIFEETPILNDMKTVEIEGEVIALDRGDYPHFALAMTPLYKERRALADDDIECFQSVAASIRMNLNEGEQ